MKDITTNQKEISELNRLTSKILQDRKQSNQIVDLIDKLANINTENNKSDNYTEALIRCLQKIFTSLIDSREMVQHQVNSDQSNDSIHKLNTYKEWLIKLYDTVIDLFLKILENSENLYSLNIRKCILLSLIKFVEEEGKFPFRAVDNDEELSFPVYLLEKIIVSLVSEQVYNQELISVYVNYYEYDDFIHYTLVSLSKIVDLFKETENSQIMANLIDFIHPIRFVTPSDLLPKSLQPEVKVPKTKKRRKGPTGDHKTWIRLCELQPFLEVKISPIKLPCKKFKFDYERDANLYSSLWLKYLRFSLPPSTYKRTLLYLDKYAIQHFANPLLLSDFLISSFQTGGIISLLSLSPLYTLMHKCNLEYPNFFLTLYNLIEPAVAYVKYRARFLFWCDLFLTSSHLSSQIVASFVKKMSRITIHSPPDTILILLPFIGNLFIRHPVIQTMLKFKQFDPSVDPFDEEELDPQKTRAINSYVWELKALQTHYHPEIVALAKQITTDLPPYEWSLEDILETKMEDVIEKTKASLEKVDKLTYDLECDIYYSI